MPYTPSAQATAFNVALEAIITSMGATAPAGGSEYRKAIADAMITAGISFTFRGAWAVGTPYIVGDVVTSGGSAWVAIAASTGVTPGTDPTKWIPFTSAFLADPGANGVVIRTALNTTTARTITGTANEVAVANGSGVGGNPTIALDPLAVSPAGSYTAANITVDTKGRVTAAASGSAGVSSVTASAPIASSGGATPNISLTGVVPVANGGTNSSTALNNNRVIVSGAGAIVEAAAGTDSQLLKGVTGGAPAWMSNPTIPGQVVAYDGSALSWLLSGGGFLWGDGSTGLATIAGAVTWAAVNYQHTVLTIQNGGALDNGRNLVLANTLVDIQAGGVLNAVGSAASGKTGAVALGSRFLYGAATGATGTTGAGTAGGNTGLAYGGSGGSGGAGAPGMGGGAGGAASWSTVQSAIGWGGTIWGQAWSTSGVGVARGGCNGGSGGGDGAAASGGGAGGAAPVLIVIAPEIIVAGTLNQNGGIGGDGENTGGKTGGGGGGGGSAPIFVCQKLTITGTVNVAGGVGGAGKNLGTNGNNGSAAPVSYYWCRVPS